MSLVRPVPISVLDGAPVAEGSTPSDALRNSIDVAKRVEDWGYRRLWVTEHHSMPGVAASAPAVLLSYLASVTDRIRLGSGGVMLPNHAPLVVAEQFGTLEAFAPGRIDLGLGRAPGADQRTAQALRRNAAGTDEEFVTTLLELQAFFQGSFPEGHPYHNVQAVPGEGNVPEILAPRLQWLQRPDRRRSGLAVRIRTSLLAGQYPAIRRALSGEFSSLGQAPGTVRHDRRGRDVRRF